jgi:hypothetical protein
MKRRLNAPPCPEVIRFATLERARKVEHHMLTPNRHPSKPDAPSALVKPKPHPALLGFSAITLIVGYVHIWRLSAGPNEFSVEGAGVALFFLGGLTPFAVAILVAHARLLTPTFSWYLRSSNASTLLTRSPIRRPNPIVTGWMTFFITQSVVQLAWIALDYPQPNLKLTGSWLGLTEFALLLAVIIPAVETAVLVAVVLALKKLVSNDSLVCILVAAASALLHASQRPVSAVAGFIVFYAGARVVLDGMHNKALSPSIVSAFLMHATQNALGVIMITISAIW